MMLGLETLAVNLALPIEIIITIIINLGLIIFYASDIRIGFMMTFIANGAMYLWFYSVGWNYYYVITIFFLSLIGMVITLFFVSGVSNISQGGAI